MKEEAKVALIEAFYEARANGDMKSVRSFLAEGVIWHEPDVGSEHTGDLVGADAVAGMISAAQKKTAGTFSLTPKQVVANGEHAVALMDWTATKGNATLEGKEVAVFRIRDGKIAEVSFHQDDIGKDREFWS
ncbi:MAG: nuclear transport factor 2 family protein [Rubrobacter sp.]